SSSSLSCLNPLSYRLLKPTWIRCLPDAISASTIFLQSSAVVASGFSQKILFPAAIAFSTTSAWVYPGEATTTASTLGSSISCSLSVYAFPPQRAAPFSALSFEAADTAATRTPRSFSLNLLIWSFPSTPQPITPTFNISFVLPFRLHASFDFLDLITRLRQSITGYNRQIRIKKFLFRIFPVKQKFKQQHHRPVSLFQCVLQNSKRHLILYTLF